MRPKVNFEDDTNYSQGDVERPRTGKKERGLLSLRMSGTISGLL